MSFKHKIFSTIAGLGAGLVNGLFGAGGGMVLVPMLSKSGAFTQQEMFSSSVVIILPICLVSLGVSTGWNLPWKEALPYLLGAIPGGIVAAVVGHRIPQLWLHRFLGALIIYGGIRYLC